MGSCISLTDRDKFPQTAGRGAEQHHVMSVTKLVKAFTSYMASNPRAAQLLDQVVNV